MAQKRPRPSSSTRPLCSPSYRFSIGDVISVDLVAVSILRNLSYCDIRHLMLTNKYIFAALSKPLVWYAIIQRDFKAADQHSVVVRAIEAYSHLLYRAFMKMRWGDLMQIIRVLQTAACGVVYGGTVRDLIRGRLDTNDIDIYVDRSLDPVDDNKTYMKKILFALGDCISTKVMGYTTFTHERDNYGCGDDDLRVITMHIQSLRGFVFIVQASFYYNNLKTCDFVENSLYIKSIDLSTNQLELGIWNEELEIFSHLYLTPVMVWAGGSCILGRYANGSFTSERDVKDRYCYVQYRIKRGQITLTKHGYVQVVSDSIVRSRLCDFVKRRGWTSEHLEFIDSSPTRIALPLLLAHRYYHRVEDLYVFHKEIGNIDWQDGVDWRSEYFHSSEDIKANWVSELTPPLF